MVAVIITTVLQLMLIYVEPLRKFLWHPCDHPAGAGHLLRLQHPALCLGRDGKNRSSHSGQSAT